MKLAILTPEQAFAISLDTIAAREAEKLEPLAEVTIEAIIGWADHTLVNHSIVESVLSGQLTVMGWEADEPVLKVSKAGKKRVRRMLKERGLKDDEAGMRALMRELGMDPDVATD